MVGTSPKFLSTPEPTHMRRWWPVQPAAASLPTIPSWKITLLVRWSQLTPASPAPFAISAIPMKDTFVSMSADTSTLYSAPTVNSHAIAHLVFSITSDFATWKASHTSAPSVIRNSKLHTLWVNTLSHIVRRRTCVLYQGANIEQRLQRVGSSTWRRHTYRIRCCTVATSVGQGSRKGRSWLHTWRPPMGLSCHQDTAGLGEGIMHVMCSTGLINWIVLPHSIQVFSMVNVEAESCHGVSRLYM